MGYVKRKYNTKKVGFSGTLDPFATGLLVVCAGRPATRHIDSFMKGRKTYQAVLQLGVETETLDPEGEMVDSHRFAGLLKDRGVVNFYIGGAYGFLDPL